MSWLVAEIILAIAGLLVFWGGCHLFKNPPAKQDINVTLGLVACRCVGGATMFLAGVTSAIFCR